MRVVLHIGLEKTATKLLQNWLYDNQVALRELGVWLSDLLGRPNNRDFSAFFTDGPDNWARTVGITTEEEKTLYFRDFLPRLSQDIAVARGSCDTFLITSEHLSSRLRSVAEVQRVKEFLDDHFDSVEIICYFREQVSQALSLYSTIMRQSGIRDVADWVTSRLEQVERCDPSALAKRWDTVFGTSALRFRIYAREAFLGQDIRRDFLHQLDPTIIFEELDNSRTSANESLFALEAAALRGINKISLDPNSMRVFADSWSNPAKTRARSAERLRVGKLTYLPAPEVVERYEALNADFLRDYLPGQSFPSVVSSAGSQMVSLEDAEAAVEEAIKIGLTAIEPLPESTIEELTALASRIDSGEQVGPSDVSLLSGIANQLQRYVAMSQDEQSGDGRDGTGGENPLDVGGGEDSM